VDYAINAERRDPYTGAVLGTAGEKQSSDQTRMAFSAGLGYALNRKWSLESKVTLSDFNGETLSWISFGASVRF
jgi:hypothetical protein